MYIYILGRTGAHVRTPTHWIELGPHSASKHTHTYNYFVLWSFRMSYCVIYFVCLFRFFHLGLIKLKGAVERRARARDRERVSRMANGCESKLKWNKNESGTINGKLKLKREVAGQRDEIQEERPHRTFRLHFHSILIDFVNVAFRSFIHSWFYVIVFSIILHWIDKIIGPSISIRCDFN